MVALAVKLQILLAVTIYPTSAADYSVSVSCSDDTVITAMLDAGTATELAGAVTAINTNPAGLPPLTCTLSQTQLAGNAAQAASGHDFAAGGGKWLLAGCGLANFSLNAHVDSSGPNPAHGHFNLRVREATCSGDVRADVLCLAVIGNIAEIEAEVSSSSGDLATATPVGTTINVRAADNKTAGTPDKLGLNLGNPCGLSGANPTPIQQGNIVVHVEDSDFDSFTNRVESQAGTDVWAKCPSGPTHNAWPADINNDGFSDITDISAVASSFGEAVPPAPTRHNVAPDPVDAFVDVTDLAALARFFGQAC